MAAEKACQRLLRLLLNHTIESGLRYFYTRQPGNVPGTSTVLDAERRRHIHDEYNRVMAKPNRDTRKREKDMFRGKEGPFSGAAPS